MTLTNNVFIKALCKLKLVINIVITLKFYPSSEFGAGEVVLNNIKKLRKNLFYFFIAF